MKRQIQYTDEELIRWIQAGGTACERAMTYLYRRQGEPVIGYITARNGSREEARDILQNAIVNLLLVVQQGRFEGKSSLQTYLISTAKFIWFRRFNRSLRQDSLEATEHDEPGGELPDLLLIEDDQARQLHALMGSLKDKCMDVLGLWAQKFSMKEIAERLGYANEQVVRNKKNHCLNELKERVRTQPSVRALVQELIGGTID
ncbi:MAG: hypothetical protein OHK0039_34000 [Bacteroidia bacterium]